MKTIAFLLLCSSLIAGESKISIDRDQSTIEILGTSSLHEWEATADKFIINGVLNESTVSRLRLEVPVMTINSGKSIMDDKIQDALNADDYPKVTFEANELKIQGDKVYGPGTLTIAGKSRPFQFSASAVAQPSGKLLVKGESRLKMTDFGVDPPTAMFGTLTTGDEVTVKYEILLTN